MDSLGKYAGIAFKVMLAAVVAVTALACYCCNAAFAGPREAVAVAVAVHKHLQTSVPDLPDELGGDTQPRVTPPTPSATCPCGCGKQNCGCARARGIASSGSPCLVPEITGYAPTWCAYCPTWRRILGTGNDRVKINWVTGNPPANYNGPVPAFIRADGTAWDWGHLYLKSPTIESLAEWARK